MFSMSYVFSLVPSVLVLLLWVAGLVASAVHPDRGRWRALAMGGFGTLAAASVVGMLPNIILMTSGYRPPVHALLAVFGIVGLILSLIGTGLVIAAVLTGRPGRPAGTTDTIDRSGTAGTDTPG
jgi:hypothetical protein